MFAMLARVSDPYRELQGGCPRCKRALRAFSGRLICDDCGGMLLTVADLGESIADLTGAEPNLSFARDEPTSDPCPRCRAPMVASAIALDDEPLLERVEHCPAHGVWLATGQLTAIFAMVGMASAGGVGRHGYGGTHAGLRIGHWQSKARVRTPSTPVDAFADRILGCPACATRLGFQGDRYSCPECTGVLVPHAALVALIAEMTGAPYELPPPTGAAGTRACPMCAEPMIVETLGTAEIDRCPEHGVWFDPTELQTVLGTVGAPKHQSWLGRLFKR